jgi:hypothetical protein
LTGGTGSLKECPARASRGRVDAVSLQNRGEHVMAGESAVAHGFTKAAVRPR